MKNIRNFDEICASCGKSLGQHYGSDRNTICESHMPWNHGIPVGYTGTFWQPTGLFKNVEGVVYFDENRDVTDPNSLFKMKRKRNGRA